MELTTDRPGKEEGDAILQPPVGHPRPPLVPRANALEQRTQRVPSEPDVPAIRVQAEPAASSLL